MKRGLDWYQREPAAFLDAIRAAKMTDTQAAVYAIVVDLLYLTGGETPNDPRYIAAHLSNVGAAKAKATIQQLVDMGKLTVVGDMLHQKRAENEAQTRKNLSVIRADAGRLGGIQSGVSRQKAKENSETGEAIASTKTEPEKRREEKRIEVVVDASAPETLFRRVLSALTLNPNDRLPTYWMPPTAEIHVARWNELGLTDDEIVAVAAANLQQHGAPPEGPRALDRSMQRLAGEKRVEALPIPVPTQGVNHAGQQPPRASRSDASLNAFLAGARRLPG